jgi:protein gp37
MSDATKIEWTDATWNPITGCSVVSPGCTHCYAMKLAGTRLAHHPSRAGLTRDTKAGPVWTGEVRLNEQWLTQPLKWKRPRKIFVCAHGDLFHESVPDEWRYLVIAAMGMTYDTATVDHQNVITARRQRHIYQVLTKRPDIQRGFMTALHDATQAGDILSHPLSVAAQKVSKLAGHPFWMNAPFTVWRWVMEGCPGLWLGVSAEDQKRANERIPDLLATPAAVRWVSAEPLLGPINFQRIRIAPDHHTIIDALDGYAIASTPTQPGRPARTALDWIVAGGESGADARPMHPDWARAIRDQCDSAGVPFFFKQNGEWIGADEWLRHLTRAGEGPVYDLHYDPARALNFDQAAHLARSCGFDFEQHSDGSTTIRVGKRRAGRLLDGRTHDGMPEDGR